MQLGSTYWETITSSRDAVLAPTGGVTVSPAPPGTCVPGGGCGTATATFTAITAGSAVVTARRRLCGEAYQCPPSQQTLQLFVVVA